MANDKKPFKNIVYAGRGEVLAVIRILIAL